MNTEREARVTGPVRTCVGCNEKGAKEDFVRVVLGPKLAGGAAEVAIDLGDGAGRGAHVHPRVGCLAKAARGGLARSFKCDVHATGEELAAQLADAYEKRVQGLVLGARRARLVAVGADASREAILKGAPLLIVASDAGSVIEEATFARSIAEGQAVIWRNKQEIGTLFGRNEVAVVAVLDMGVAQQIQVARSRSEACKRPEVR